MKTLAALALCLVGGSSYAGWQDSNLVAVGGVSATGSGSSVLFSRTNQGVSPLPTGGVQGAGFSRTLQGTQLESQAQSATLFQVIPSGAMPGATCYSTVVGTTALNLAPTNPGRTTHIWIQNNGLGTVRLGGPNVTAGANGPTLSNGVSVIWDHVAPGPFAVFAIRTGAQDATVEVCRW